MLGRLCDKNGFLGLLMPLQIWHRECLTKRVLAPCIVLDMVIDCVSCQNDHKNLDLGLVVCKKCKENKAKFTIKNIKGDIVGVWYYARVYLKLHDRF